MKIRTIALLGALTTMVSAVSANAAVTVITGGEAEACYQAAEEQWDPDTSIPICNFALNGFLSPRDRAATLVNRGILKLAKVDGAGSLADFDKGLQIDANIAEGYVDRGASLIILQRFPEAIVDINKGIAMNTDKLAAAYFDRGMANDRLGNLVAAYHDYKQSQLIDPFFDPPTKALQGMTLVVKPAGS